MYYLGVDTIPSEASCITTDSESGVRVYAYVTQGRYMSESYGSYTFTCSYAEDNAGNRTAPITFSYEIREY